MLSEVLSHTVSHLIPLRTLKVHRVGVVLLSLHKDNLGVGIRARIHPSFPTPGPVFFHTKKNTTLGRDQSPPHRHPGSW